MGLTLTGVRWRIVLQHQVARREINECFSDQEVADLLNEAFICIKVDRDERPFKFCVYSVA